MEENKTLKKVSFVVNILAILFVIFLIFITVIFVSARNNHGMLTFLSVGYFSDGDFLYTVNFTDEYKVTEESIGKGVAYYDEDDNLRIAYGIIEAETEVKDYELPKLTMTDGSIVKVRDVIGTISGKSGAELFNLATTSQGYILAMTIPGVIFVVYYAVMLFIALKNGDKSKKTR